MRNRRRGLLFGPREAGCWHVLLTQAWLCAVIAGVAAHFTKFVWVQQLALMFASEAVGLTLFLLSVAQAFWFEERFPSLGWLLQVVGYVFLGTMLCLMVLPLFPALGQVIAYLLQFLLASLGLSLLLRIVSWVMDQFQGQ